jgi:hypothetical protein
MTSTAATRRALSRLPLVALIRGGALLTGIGVLAAIVILRDDGPLAGYPDIHRRGP